MLYWRKEPLKISKEMQKQLLKQIKLIARSKGYRVRSDCLYQVRGDNFIYCDYDTFKPDKLDFSIHVKKYSYDNIFWDIMDMKDNKKESDSLRADGAFSAPSVEIEADLYELSEDINSIANQLLEEVETVTANFLANNDVNLYVLEHENKPYDKIIRCLAYIDMKQYEQAKEIAREAIEAGDIGKYISGGKGFFEWLLSDSNY